MNQYTDKYLIINADDLGYNEEQNAAITELYRAGEISSVSVLTVTACAESGARIAREENMSAGIHFALTSDEENERWHSVSGARSLADDKGLYTGGFRLALSARRKDVRKELEAQYSFLTARGITPDYADSHSGTLYGINGRRFYRDAFKFCSERDLPFRFPKSPAFIARQLGRAPRAIVALHAHVVRLAEKYGVTLIDDLMSNPWRTGEKAALNDYYVNAVKELRPGITEMFLHPALPVENMTPEWQKRTYEYEILKSGAIREAAEKAGVKIISRADIKRIVKN